LLFDHQLARIQLPQRVEFFDEVFLLFAFWFTAQRFSPYQKNE